MRFALLLLAATLSAAPHTAFLGRWNFTMTMPNGGTRAMWLGIKESAGAPEVWYQPTGGNVFQVKEPAFTGGKLSLKLGQNATLELEPKGDTLAGVIKRGEMAMPVTGVRAPELKRPMPAKWSKPEPLFNGKDLSGWEPMGNPANNQWTVVDGLLTNKEKGANLRSTRKFDDFKLHFEVKYPEHTNSGFYLRGRYEIQIESEPAGSAPPERRMASIYGRIAPKPELPLKTGEWETFDVTLVGRTLTVVRNGVTIIGQQELEGITGGAIDANEAEPGPFYIQGDHAGGVQFRNITISVPAR